AAGGGGGVDPNSGGFTTAEKYTTLSTQRLQSSNNVDAMEVMGTGPYSITAGDTITVAFALLAGDDLADLQGSAANAQIAYDGITLSKNESLISSGIFIYPNPVKDLLTIDFANPTEKGVLEIYNVMGQQLKTIQIVGGKSTIATTDFAAGTYICRFIAGNKISIKKFVVDK
ncbi:MAG: T9SS type A sorting domain-containing protein, partial [Bacteroidota bacterium]